MGTPSIWEFSAVDAKRSISANIAAREAGRPCLTSFFVRICPAKEQSRQGYPHTCSGEEDLNLNQILFRVDQELQYNQQYHPKNPVLRACLKTLNQHYEIDSDHLLYSKPSRVETISAWFRRR